MAAATIFALASGAGRAGVAVLRISGPDAREALGRLSGRPPPPPRELRRRRLRDEHGGLLDDALVVHFPAPASFTGEDVVELHVHGGRAVVQAVEAALARCPDLRPAEAGEFTRRAFDNGRLDLTAVEGLADLIQAETEAQRRQAFRHAEGEFGRRAEAWRADLLRARALLEATLDFSDEDLPSGLIDEGAAIVAALRREIAASLDVAAGGRRIRDGFRVAVVGAPNAGKSSLLNRLARREAAIVSPTPGTTRDVIEVALDIGGFPVLLMDTAGLRASDCAIEAEGVARARSRAAEADVVLVVLDGETWPTTPADVAPLITDAALVVVSKADRWAIDGTRGTDGSHETDAPAKVIATSVVDDTGIGRLVEELTDRLRRLAQEGAAPPPTRERHRRALADCLAALTRVDPARDPELAAEELRLAADALGRLTGRVDVEEVLDRIFAEFCIGK